jgi:predicted MPP superfamily phosphohydrolase
VQNPSFRTPLSPAPIEAFDIIHPQVPVGPLSRGRGLEGLRILHISDLHVRRVAHASDRFGQLCRALAQTPSDLIVLTGDYTDEPGHEAAAVDSLQRLAMSWQPPTLGAFGIFGNHDSNELLHAVQAVRGVTWLGGPGRTPAWSQPHPQLRLIGLDWPEDFIAATLDAPPPSQDQLTIALAHYPTALMPAASVGLPLVLAGHTHAGQIRVSSRLAPHTSSDVPAHLASGVLRLDQTLCCISRGVGDGVFEGLRINCPWQVPLYTLRNGPLPPLPRHAPPHAVTQALAW